MAQKGVFERVFESLSGDPDFEYAIIDGTIVRVHQHGRNAVSPEAPAQKGD